MLEPNRQQERPTQNEIEEFWSTTVVFDATPFSSPAIEDLLEKFAFMFREPRFGMFSFCDHEVLCWFVSRRLFDEISFFEKFLTSLAVNYAFPDLQVLKSNGVLALELEELSSYCLDGDLARTLMRGGPFERHTTFYKRKRHRSGRTAKELGKRVCFELFEDRYEDVEVFRTRQPWSRWFEDFGWDNTWIGVDRRNLKIWLLCVTAAA